ncbi:extracellular solute-binding protein [Nitratireductor sp. XY-223]|uniref:ABC transporter substrate-binding protein n=1 Tax=Nitratireductor sp. XY-223 TaxID=2561926 RepID=UPI0010AA440A|nr:extracellular solute-binding protein [Nitratireductor sp. XY-223]
MPNLSRRKLFAAAIVAPTLMIAGPVTAQDKGDVTISHYFTGEFGQKVFNEQVAKFEKDTGYKLKNSPIGHEDFKTGILVQAAGKSLPDVFSYWAGARVQFVVDSGALHPIDDMWKKDGLDKVIAKSVADSATVYDGKRYLVPFNYHYAGMFYNTKVMADAGITEMPKTWEEFLAACETLKGKGVTPIALGSKDRWPAQFWFDYLLLRTAGPEYRAKLMDGSASYDDEEVKHAMGLWKELVDKGYFVANANADGWTDASDKVARGDAAMTLMGTWITGYWNGIGLVPADDYDFFPFPEINAGVSNAVVGPVDGLVIAANAENVEGAEAFVDYMTANVDVQTEWTKTYGALSANVNVDPANYNAVMQKAFTTVANAETFAFNYDLATPPPVAEVGLSMFARFMDDPSKVDDILAQASSDAAGAFKQ